MTDIADLGLRIRSDGVVVARDRLRDFDRQADHTERRATALGAAVGRAFALIGAAFSVNQLINYTNSWTDLNSRVEIATGSMGQGAATMERLSEMARRTYSSLELTAETFLLNARAMKDLGYNSGQTLDFVESVNNALVVSGAKGERAASVVNALSKAMALGKLSGDQLETVLASGGRVAEALADSLGVTTLELRAMGAEGKLTGDVIYRGLTSQLELLREEADSMPATIGDAFTLLNNSIMGMVGRFDQASGSSSRLAEAVIWVADAMNTGVISIERMIAYATGMAAVMAGIWVSSFIAANGATATLVATLGLLRTALIRTGIGALVVLAGELTYQLYRVVEGSGSVGEAFQRMGRSGAETLQRLGDAGQALVAVLDGVSAKIVASFSRARADILQGFIGMMNSIAGRGNPFSMGAADAWMGAQGRASDYDALASSKFGEASAAWDRVWSSKSRVDEVGTMPGFGDIAGTLGGSGGSGTAAGLRDIGDAAGAANDNLKKLADEGMTDVEDKAFNVAEAMKAALQGLGSGLFDALKQGGDIASNVLSMLIGKLEQFATAWLDKIIGNGIDALFSSMGGFGMSSGLRGTSSITGSSGGFFPGFPSADGGGYTGSGSRSGGLDGKGGFMAMLHPRETIIDHTKPANNNQRINVQTNIINNAGVEVQENTYDDGNGGIRQEIVLNRAIASQIAKPGPAQKAVMGTGRLVRR